MRIVLVSSEAVPYAKTGGLADVTSALTKSLSQAGHEVWLILPYYPRALARHVNRVPQLHSSGVSVEIPVGSRRSTGNVLWSEMPGCAATVLLVDQQDYFDRPGLYQDSSGEYKDNCERFVFFSRAAVEICRQLMIRPDVIHANDWQAGLIPALLSTERRHDPIFAKTGSVMTIHNLAYQGQFWHWDMLLTGLDWKYFNWRQMESFGQLNLLKTGIVFADLVTTVSPTYASEIQTPEGGCGLDGALSARREDLVGILNGVDTEVWNPQTDSLISHNYGVNNFVEGKAGCKASLQQRLNLPQQASTPLLGMISRMVDQKGFDLIAGGMERLLQRDVQFAFLGTGEERYQEMLKKFAAWYPEKVAVVIGFDEGLAHQIEAGADAYLMPSRYEPCGLNQMYSLIYGTVPIVRTVGGLADSVVDVSESSLLNETATGFRFQDYDTNSFVERVEQALDLFEHRQIWNRLVKTGMSQDWSWGRSAAAYVDLYRQAHQRRISTV